MNQSYQVAVQRIEAARVSGATELDLFNLGLTDLPPELWTLTSLKRLFLGDNKLRELPREVGQLTSLIELDLCMNQLSELPSEIGRLASLAEFNLIGNQLLALPAEVGQLRSLKRLTLGDNQLSELPANFGQLALLTTLGLWENQLSTLPAEIGQLRSLTELRLGGNQLSELPAEISQLRSLTELHLSGNQLSTLPSEVGQLRSLTMLYLGNNRLSALPAGLSQLAHLKKLNLNGNSIPEIPSHLLESSEATVAIVRYVFKTKPGITIQVPPEWRTALAQYLMYFGDFCTRCKGHFVCMNVHQTKDGLTLELVETDLDSNSLEAIFREFLALPRQSRDRPEVEFAPTIPESQREIEQVRLENTLTHLENALRIAKVEAKHYLRTIEFQEKLLFAAASQSFQVIQSTEVRNTNTNTIRIGIDLRSELPRLQDGFHDAKRALIEALPEQTEEIEELGKAINGLSVKTDSEALERSGIGTKLRQILRNAKEKAATANRGLGNAGNAAGAVDKLIKLYKHLEPHLGWFSL